ncbi:nucleotide sugar dehydrogenase [Corynebacterium sp. CCM 9185]|uniref:Nucleotide sugar dehydrogenase n=1 Tax=Corynebacterium marambiense TaxID=2765364 RepID=A0ABS0VWN1_9CORY|nr:nucleotide sugar dehydrogenase [Corynebacterium marambiense]MBI9001183.1 nucleotide sugar dehydrogenase [Corynebacterium marambiense]MCK7663743.1 nucleotide sugar dehydrogenase [Corynebacterium marambiense]
MKKNLTIVGQGYVGLPLAQEACLNGWHVSGYDVNEKLISKINAGISHIDDISDQDLKEMIKFGYSATSDQGIFKTADVIVVCVPTPLGEAGSPDLSAVKSAMNSIGSNMSKGGLVILESTTYPGTTEEICIPILESESGLKAGEEFYVAFSPERVDPGSTKYNIKNTPKLVGGCTPEATKRAVEFYSDFIDTVVPLSGAKEAETAKLLENTFRHVNIALVNEMAKFCNELKIDIWEVINGAATKPFGFMKFTPGPGVGGHCIPIDPNYLSHEVRRRLGYPFRFVELAQEINSTMPAYVVSRVGDLLNEDRKAINGATVAILGVTYKPDISDQRESPARPIGKQLLLKGANLKYYDPYVPKWNLDGEEISSCESINEAISIADVVVIVQNHSQFDLAKIANSGKLVLDTRGIAPFPARKL